MSRPRLVALALSATALMAGCGGKSTLTRSQLLAKAEPICARINAKLSAVTSATKPQDMSRTAAELESYSQQATSELSRLSAPNSLSGDWQAIVAGYRTASAAVSKLGREAAAAKGKPNISTIQEFTNAQHYRTSTALRDGFKECSTT